MPAGECVRRIEWFEIGVRYHMYHAAALLGVGLLAQGKPKLALAVAGWAFLLGVLLFSGLLYVMALSGLAVLGRVVPIGGLLLIAAWLALAWSAIRPIRSGV